MNVSRANWVEDALNAYKEGGTNGDDLDTRLGDFMCDVQHFARQNGLDFENLLERGRVNFEIERKGVE